MIAADEDFPKCRFLNLPFDNIYRACDYCGNSNKIAVLNQPVYYDKGRKRKLVSYCDECDRIPVIKRELVDGACNQAIHSSTVTISFEDAVKKAYYQNNEVSRYLGYSQTGTRDPNYKQPEPFELHEYNQHLCKFRYKIQHEEPRVKVLQEDPLIISWNKQEG